MNYTGFHIEPVDDGLLVAASARGFDDHLWQRRFDAVEVAGMEVAVDSALDLDGGADVTANAYIRHLPSGGDKLVLVIDNERGGPDATIGIERI